MAAESDEDALSWGEGSDPTHVESPQTAHPAADVPKTSEPRGDSAILVTYGVFGGIFLLYVVGWLLGVRTMALGSAGVFAQVMDRIGQFLALLSPALWFFGVLLLIPSTRPRTRIIWLVVGVILLAPWLFFFGL